MSFASSIQSVRELVGRFPSGGNPVAADLVRHVKTLADEAKKQSLEALASACVQTANTINTAIGDEQLEACGELLAKYLVDVVAYIDEWADAVERGADKIGSVIPVAPDLPNGDEERQYAESVGMFVGNALGSLSDLEEELLGVESAGERLADSVSSIRRTVHTLKAEFGVLNMMQPQTLCHQAETTIDACTENEVAFPVDTMLAFCDLIKQFVERLANDVHAEFGDAEPMLVKLRTIAEQAESIDDDAVVVLDVGGDFADSLPEFVSEARSHLADAEVAMVELSRDPENVENLNLTFRAFHTIKGVAGFLNLDAIVELAHVAETLLDGGRSQTYRFVAEDIDLVLAAGDMITQMIASLEGQAAPLVRDWRKLIGDLKVRASRGPDQKSDDATTEEVVAVEAPDSGAGVTPTNDADPASITQPQVEAEASAQPAVQKSPTTASEAKVAGASENPGSKGGVVQPQQKPGTKNPAAKAARVERTIKVSTTRLDMLVDMVGELVIAQSMVLQDPAIQRLADQSLSRNIGQVGKITRDLQEAAMSLRMVTVKSTFQKMARLVRDVASKSQKRVALSIAGEDTELDRNVVEQISDPLVHMIRNAIDHGIESPDDRIANGKEAEGQLSLSAYHQGGSIVIEIKDDGRGIDRDRVFDKAINKGLIPAGTNPASMSDAEVFNMIFMPGFSTAEKVTDLSGRGVGMDVVRRNIEALRGKIEIDSTKGQGSTFRLRLPLTLAIIDGMIVRVGKNRYVVPTLSIEQSFRPTVDDVHHVVDRGECVHVRGAVLPIYRLKEIFVQADGADDLADGILIVVEVDGQRSCLFVDEIVGQQQVVIKSLGMSRDRIVGLSGGAIMTDGRVALIIDVGTLVESVLTT